MEKTSRPGSSSSHCATQDEERQVTVAVPNPHTPREEVTAFLRRFCTVVKNPTKILDENGFWTSEWSVTVRLRKDPSTSDGLQHLPHRCILGNSDALITYSDMSPISSKMEETLQPDIFSSQCSTESKEKEATPGKDAAAFLDCPKRTKKNKKNQRRK